MLFLARAMLVRRLAGSRYNRTSPQPPVLFCFGLFWSTHKTDAFCLFCRPLLFWGGRRRRGRGREGPPAAGLASFGGPRQNPRRGPRKKSRKYQRCVSNKISALLEGLSLATCGPMHSQRPDCIGALHFAFASRPYRPCTCLSSDLLCAVRRLRPGFPAHEHDHPANADVSAVRTKSEVLVHAMRAETTEALVVCSEHVGSTPEQANAVLPVRLPLFGLVTRGVAEKE